MMQNQKHFASDLAFFDDEIARLEEKLAIVRDARLAMLSRLAAKETRVFKGKELRSGPSSLRDINKTLEDRAVEPENMNIAEAARLILRKEGRPMRTMELTEMIIQQGLYRGSLKANFLVNTVFSALRRFGGTFAKHGKGVWSLRASVEQGGTL